MQHPSPKWLYYFNPSHLQHVKVLAVPHPQQYLVWSIFNILVDLLGMKWYHCGFNLATGVGHLLMCLLDISETFVNEFFWQLSCLFSYSWVIKILHIFQIWALCQIYKLWKFSASRWFTFSFVTTIILNSLSGSSWISISLGSITAAFFCSFGGVMLSWFFTILGALLQCLHIWKSGHLFQFLRIAPAGKALH